jgi:hypothetical protein
MKKILSFVFFFKGEKSNSTAFPDKITFVKQKELYLEKDLEYSPDGRQLYAGKVTGFFYDEEEGVHLTLIVNEKVYGFGDKSFITEFMQKADWEILPEQEGDLD